MCSLPPYTLKSAMLVSFAIRVIHTQLISSVDFHQMKASPTVCHFQQTLFYSFICYFFDGEFFLFFCRIRNLLAQANDAMMATGNEDKLQTAPNKRQMKKVNMYLDSPHGIHIRTSRCTISSRLWVFLRACISFCTYILRQGARYRLIWSNVHSSPRIDVILQIRNQYGIAMLSGVFFNRMEQSLSIRTTNREKKTEIFQFFGNILYQYWQH